eukprot:COSAG06_NODE_71604_length_182_cov_13.891566_1_plen_34_part_10
MVVARVYLTLSPFPEFTHKRLGVCTNPLVSACDS